MHPFFMWHHESTWAHNSPIQWGSEIWHFQILNGQIQVSLPKVHISNGIWGMQRSKISLKLNLTIVFLSKNSRSILTLKSWSPTIWKPTKMASILYFAFENHLQKNILNGWFLDSNVFNHLGIWKWLYKISWNCYNFLICLRYHCFDFND